MKTSSKRKQDNKRKRLMGISNVKSPIWALLQHLKTLQKLRDYKISDAPTFSIAETTRTDHFSLSLRKLPNRNRPEPTLKSCGKNISNVIHV